MTVDRVQGTAITIVNDGSRCIHSRYCVLNLPQVCVPNSPGEWIFPDAAPVDAVIAMVTACPSGALRYERNDGLAGEAPPGVNHLRIHENGPYSVHADLTMPGHDTGFRATLCRCGQSAKKPFCDGAHAAVGFTATGEPAAQDSAPLDPRGGPLTVTPAPNGPLMVSGALEICGASGHTLNRVTRTALCRCGASGNKPYCDGSHARIGFVAP